jgi:D-alanyl-lipoteichoic acid acyltransferase DltB (MBOAT superfamily)
MLFNSLEFILFFALFLAAYFGSKGKARLWVSAIGSYFFYGWWDWRFCSLLFLSTFTDYHLAAMLASRASQASRRRILVFSLVVNLGVLALFKYYDFFAVSLQAGLGRLGWQVGLPMLHLALPIGISFYTFHSLSYTIDVYRRELAPEPSFLRYTVFVAFFPHLVAGPIVRAHDILPQLRRDHEWSWDRWTSGFSLVVWGLFKKVVVADTLSELVDHRFAHPELHGSLSLLIGVIAYALQIYADFSGYSDVAIGLARIFGIEFPINFVRPYFATSFREFWTRWHVSLSTWLRDYLYIPLGGNRGGRLATYRNLALTMLLGGLWHGASWTFVLWGALHGSYLVIERMLARVSERVAFLSSVPVRLRRALGMLTVFSGTCLAWVFFRAQSVGDAWLILRRIACAGDWNPASLPQAFLLAKACAMAGCLVLVDVATEWFDGREHVRNRPALRLGLLASALWGMSVFGSYYGAKFIYFQF